MIPSFLWKIKFSMKNFLFDQAKNYNIYNTFLGMIPVTPTEKHDPDNDNSVADVSSTAIPAIRMWQRAATIIVKSMMVRNKEITLITSAPILPLLRFAWKGTPTMSQLN